MQAVQYIQSLSYNPPIAVWGDVPQRFKMTPNAIWRMGAQNSTKYEVVNINTTAISNYPTMYGLVKSQMLNLSNMMDSSTSASSGNPGFSKTDAGVNMQNARLGISDNYMRKQFESWFEDMAETMMNLYFGERSGKEMITVDDETAAKLIAAKCPFIVEDNQVEIDFDEMILIHAEADAGTSAKKEDQDTVESLTQAIELATKLGLDKTGVIDIAEAFKRIVISLGVQDPEKIVPDQQQDKKTFSEDDRAMIQALQAQGYGQEAIGRAVAMLHHGYPEEEIMNYLRGVQQ
jgi:hypothetical protein